MELIKFLIPWKISYSLKIDSLLFYMNSEMGIDYIANY